VSRTRSFVQKRCSGVRESEDTGVSNSPTHFRRRASSFLMCVLAVSSLLTALPAPPAAAAAFYQWTSPPPNSSSRYVYNDAFSTGYGNAMYSEGYNEACAEPSYSNGVWYMVVLDFGQVWNGGTPNYGGYGTRLTNYPYPYIRDADIVQAAYWYGYGWYVGNLNCAGYSNYLFLGVGVNNYRACGTGDSGCASGGGTNWGLALADIEHYGFINNGQSDRIFTESADDIEGGWDCFTTTSAFANGFVAHDSYSMANFDYGDASLSQCFQGQVWYPSQFYYVAWTANGIPLPETYLQGQIDNWMNVRALGTMFFYGNMTQKPAYGMTAYQGWQALWNSLNAHGFGQPYMPLSTNI
jgi:hypothetical protein